MKISSQLQLALAKHLIISKKVTRLVKYDSNIAFLYAILCFFTATTTTPAEVIKKISVEEIVFESLPIERKFFKNNPMQHETGFH